MAQVKNQFAQPDATGDNALDLAGTWKVGGVAVTASAAELNAMDGVTASAAELNILDGVTSSAAELNKVDGALGYMQGNPVAGKLCAGGETAVTADHATANAVVIATGLTTIVTAQVEIVDASNVRVVQADAVVSFSGGNLTVADGAVYNTVETDKVRWIVFGV